MITDLSHLVTNPSGFRPLGKLIGIALHHTVTTISPAATPDEEIAHIRRIDAYHASLGWGGFGYHYAVMPSGRVYRTGSGSRAHVASRNHELIGIAWVGDLSGRRPTAIEIAAAAEAVQDAWERAGEELPIKGHRDWALPAYPTACPGRGIEVIEEVKMGTGIDATLRDRVTALERQLERLERIVAGHGEISVTADTENAALLSTLTGTTVKLGQRVKLSGEKSVVYLDLMGNNLYLGLSITQQIAAKAAAAAESASSKAQKALDSGSKPPSVIYLGTEWAIVPASQVAPQSTGG